MARRPDSEARALEVKAGSRAAVRPSAFEHFRWGRIAIWCALSMVVLVGSLFAWHRTEEFLIRDDRFRLAEPQDFAGLSPSLAVEGVHYASSSQIRHIFASDFGRSLYLVPLAVRRKELLGIDWVEAATVSKLWPNTLKVKIVERKPVAFIHLPARRRDGLSEFALIDRDGYILRPKVAAKFTLPVIDGIGEGEPREDRRQRVRRTISVLESLGSLAAHITEVDVSEPGNLVVAERMENRVVNLSLGDENFSARMANFLNSYNEIKQKRPDATTFDLRVDNMITVAGERK